MGERDRRVQVGVEQGVDRAGRLGLDRAVRAHPSAVDKLVKRIHAALAQEIGHHGRRKGLREVDSAVVAR